MAGIVDSEDPSGEEFRDQDSLDGVHGVLAEKDVRIAFDATSATAHLRNAPLLRESGKITLDLTPAAIGPRGTQCQLSMRCKAEANLNMVTCGGQATVPIVHAINTVKARYAEIVACIASKSAGPAPGRTSTSSPRLCRER